MGKAVIHSLTASRIENYGVGLESTCFQEIKLTVQDGVKLTQPVVLKVLGAFVKMFLAKTAFTNFYTEGQKEDKKRFVSLRKEYTATFKTWKSIQAEGYSITIIR